MLFLLRSVLLPLTALLAAGTLVACDPEAAGSAEPGLAEAGRAAGPSRLDTDREIAAAHADGELGDRLVVDQQLLVDAQVPANSEPTGYVLLRGALARPPSSIVAVVLDPKLAGRVLRRSTLGGEDSERPVIFHDISPDEYTACAEVGGASDSRRDALAARAEVAYEAAGGGPLTAEKLRAAIAVAEAELGEAPQGRTTAEPLRCRTVEVTDAPETRVVALVRE